MLVRKLRPGQRTVVWCMLNPSKASEYANDRTINKCMGFSKRWGYDRMVVVNLSPLIATKPQNLFAAGMLPGDIRRINECAVLEAAAVADRIVVAYGDNGGHPVLLGLKHATLETLKSKGFELWCLGVTKARNPRHPRNPSYSQPLERFDTHGNPSTIC